MTPYLCKEENLLIAMSQVQVGIAPYSLHRDETIYEDPDSFNPERWLDSDEQKLNKMKLAWIPFGHGARICVGQ